MKGNDASSLPIGTVLKGKYRIVSHLSSGGFGKTYLAVYGPHDTKVAIKEFFMSTANQRETDGVSVSVDHTKKNADAFDSQLAKFKKEYERLKQISNVHVVKVHECFEENGTAYYVMEFVEGDDLKSRLKQRGKPYAEKTVLGYLKQILDGLAAIHSANLMHLDIKPANIMITSRGDVKLIDLGASKDYESGYGATVFTGVAYSDGYAPSEQVNRNYDKIGPWSDFYALGATIYHLLTCNDIPTWTDIQEDKSSDKHIALPMPGISEGTKQLVVWMMNIERLKRPHSVEEILTRLNAPIENRSSYGEETLFTSDTIDGTVIVNRQPPHRQEIQRQNKVDGSTSIHKVDISKQNATQEKEPEFSFVGCLYILIIIAIIVFVIKSLFLA